MKFLSIFIAVAGICFFSCKDQELKTPVRDMTDISAMYVKTALIGNYAEGGDIKATGIIMSESEARPSFKTGGVIYKTYVKEGDLVKKGQLLATLIMDEIDAQVRQAEEGLIKAERDMNRVKKLYADSVATLEQYQNVTTGYEVSKRTAEIARFNRNYSEVRSPINGKIIKQIMRSGEVTGPGTPVYAIMGIGSQDWIIRVGLIDRDWARVKISDKVAVRMDAYPGKSFEAYISNKTSVGGNASGTFDVELKFRKPPANLAAGLTSDVIISTENKESFPMIPIEALVKTNGNTAQIFTIADGKAKKITITIGKLMGDKVAVSGGLEGVKEVVTTGSMYLEDGDQVKIK